MNHILITNHHNKDKELDLEEDLANTKQCENISNSYWKFTYIILLLKFFNFLKFMSYTDIYST